MGLRPSIVEEANWAKFRSDTVDKSEYVVNRARFVEDVTLKEFREADDEVGSGWCADEAGIVCEWMDEDCDDDATVGG